MKRLRKFKNVQEMQSACTADYVSFVGMVKEGDQSAIMHLHTHVPILPTNLVISCSNNTVTITASRATSIQYKIGSSGEYVTYTEPFAITETVTVYAKAINEEGSITTSQECVYSDFTGIELSQELNVATIEVAGLDTGTGYYTINGGSQVPLTEGTTTIPVTEGMDGQTLLAYGVFSGEATEETLVLSWVDYSPEVSITESDNYVTIISAMADTIQYRLGSSGEYSTYTEPVYIAEDTTIYVIATRTVSGVAYTTETSQEVTHTSLPSNLVISCSNNTVTITADNATTIEYNTDGSSTYITYTEPFAITQTVTVYAKATNSDGSITASQECEYVNPYAIPFYIEDVSGSENTVQIKKYASSAPTLTIEKSSDGENWETMGSTSTTAIAATVPANGKLYLRCNATTWATSYDYNAITTTGNFNVGGNIMSLLYGSNFTGNETAFPSNVSYIFNDLFYGNTHIVSTAKLLLPATTLANFCYQNMFRDCTSLTSAPALPATTLAVDCYYYMFYNCTALTSAPATLPATTLATNCYCYMFGGCTSLTSAPVLPATTLANGCYTSMFYGCTSLTSAPALPATTLAQNCYEYMFNRCTHLTSAPVLPATTLAQSCYGGMFKNCTSLTSAPALPATTLAGVCYQSMFEGCTALTTAPVLPATTLTEGCYNGMFIGCTSLTTAPALPATTLTQSCYDYMFQNCTALTTAPALPATTLNGAYCYRYMFNGCTHLNHIRCLATNISATDCTYLWVYKVASNGTFFKNPNMSSWTIGNNGIPTNWVVKNYGLELTQALNVATIKVGDLDTGTGYYTINGGSQVSLSEGTTTVPITEAMNGQTLLVYSEFGGEAIQETLVLSWVDYTPSVTITETNNYVTITSATADTITYRLGSSGEYTAYTEPVYIAANTTIYVIATRTVSGVAYTTETSQEVTHVLIPPTNLVISCSNNTVTIGATNATTLEYNTDGGSTYITYTEPFAITQTVTVYAKATNADGSITASQECEYTDYAIPFYIEDVSGSSNTVQISRYGSSAPTLTIEKSSDGVNWESMGTTSTTAITATVPANGKLYLRCSTNSWGTISASYYNYINTIGNCNVGGNIMSLLYGSNFTGNETTFPSNVDFIFSHLFYNNTHIVSAAKLLLPATTLTPYCYSYMFNRCTSLTTAPVLPATTLANNCYQYMFQGCTSLTSAPELPVTTLTQDCYNNMFQGCTSLTSAPELPATTLANNCYQNMFYGCTSLTTAPVLPATTLANNCYQYMFQGCTSLTSAPELPATTLATYCYKNMFYGCTSLSSAPVLPATTLASDCYVNMFYNCTSLNYIKCLATNISASSSTSNWVYNVASSGTFVKDPSMESWTTGVNGIPTNWVVKNSTGVYLTQALNVASIEVNDLDTGTGYYTINGGSHISLSEGITTIPVMEAMNGQTLLAYGEFGGEAIQETLVLSWVDYTPSVSITETNNFVTITSATADSITYRLGSSGEYSTYTEPVYIAADTTIYVIATRTVSGVVYTANASQEVTHTVLPPANLVISCSNNKVTITADYATTIEYNTDGGSSYTTYTEPFAITETVTVYARATNSDGSITGSQECVYQSIPFAENLIFYAPLGEGDLTDHINGLDAIIPSNITITWDATKGMYSISNTTAGTALSGMRWNLNWNYRGSFTIFAHVEVISESGNNYFPYMSVTRPNNDYYGVIKARNGNNGDLAMTCDSSASSNRFRFYRDGSQIATTNWSVDTIYAPQVMGGASSNSSCTAYIKDVRVYNRTFTAAEIAQLSQ